MPPSAHKRNRIQPTLPTNPRLRAIAALLLELHSKVPSAVHSVHAQRRILAALESLQLVDMVVDENHVIEYILRMDEEQDAGDSRQLERMKAGMEGRSWKTAGDGVAVQGDERTETRRKKGCRSVYVVDGAGEIDEWEIIAVTECEGVEKNGKLSKGWCGWLRP